MLFTACNVKDPIHETDHPDKARVTLSADWTGIDPNLTKPAKYTAVVNGTEYKDIPTVTESYTFPDIAPGSYAAYLYNETEGISMSGTTAAATYTSTPLDWLFTGKLSETVEADRDYEFTVPIKQHVRELTLIIEPTGGTADNIEGITATLGGVAGTLDFSADTHGAATNAPLAFSKITNGTDAGKWMATVRLLGVTGAEQKLTGTITYVGGTPAATPLESDLTSGLASFNADKKTPMTLGGTVETPTKTGFTATINDWTTVSGTGTAD